MAPAGRRASRSGGNREELPGCPRHWSAIRGRRPLLGVYLGRTAGTEFGTAMVARATTLSRTLLFEAAVSQSAQGAAQTGASSATISVVRMEMIKPVA